MASRSTIGFLLTGGFPIVTLSTAIEPFRAANDLTNSQRYVWHVLTEDGGPVRSSSNVMVTPDGRVFDAPSLDMLFVVSGSECPLVDETAVHKWLRTISRHGTKLGAISGGVFPVARAGLLDGLRCSVHWYYVNAFTEEFPNVTVTNRLFEIDQDILTCAGGTASLDLMLTLMSDDLGRAVNTEISSWFQHPRIRDVYDEQYLSAVGELSMNSETVTRAVAIIRASIESPMPIGALADRVGVSPRQLERQFKVHLGTSPVNFYRRERLKRARELLLYTNLPISEIAVATGFGSQSHFARSYRVEYGRSPKEDQKAIRRGQPTLPD